ncbi:MAG: NAD(P)H-binding protein [Trebonia sp.]
MSILVTGATGHLGRLTVEALLARGVQPAEIVATGRDTGKIKDLAGRGVNVRRADFADPSGLAEAFAGADRLLLVSTASPAGRVAEHQHAIDAAKAAGVSLLAYTSVTHAAADQMTLAADHRETENYLRGSGIPFTMLRNSPPRPAGRSPIPTCQPPTWRNYSPARAFPRRSPRCWPTPTSASPAASCSPTPATCAG